MLADGEMTLPSLDLLSAEDARTTEVLHEHLKKLQRTLEEDANGITRWEYLRGVPNHFGMALNYARLARAFVADRASRAQRH